MAAEESKEPSFESMRLCMGVAEGIVEEVEAALDAGASPQDLSCFPLHTALERNDMPIVRLLADRGECRALVLRCAAENNRPDAVREFLRWGSPEDLKHVYDMGISQGFAGVACLAVEGGLHFGNEELENLWGNVPDPVLTAILATHPHAPWGGTPLEGKGRDFRPNPDLFPRMTDFVEERVVWWTHERCEKCGADIGHVLIVGRAALVSKYGARKGRSVPRHLGPPAYVSDSFDAPYDYLCETCHSTSGPFGDETPGGVPIEYRRLGVVEDPIREKRGDAFEDFEWRYRDGTLAHCISADKKMGGGFALQVRKRFGCPEGSAAVGEHILQGSGLESMGPIAHLVAKERFSQKPTLETLAQAFESLCRRMWAGRMSHLAMPRLGCGLDRLSWDDVRPLLAGILDDYGLTAVVYTF